MNTVVKFDANVDEIIDSPPFIIPSFVKAVINVFYKSIASFLVIFIS